MATGSITKVIPTIETSGNWSVIKYPDGRVELHYIDYAFSFTPTASRGNYYFADLSFNLPLQVFDGVISGAIGGNSAAAAPIIANLRAYQSTCNFSVGSTSNSPVSNQRLSISIFGRWK